MNNLARAIFVSASMFLSFTACAVPGLNYATFLGGSGEDNTTALAKDLLGNVYVGGSTDSHDLPSMALGNFPATLHGDQQLCFVTRLSPDGKTIDFTTILPFPSPTLEPLQGASQLDRSAPRSNGECRITALDVDIWGTLYVAGVTTLVDTGDANHPASVPAGSALGFVQKFRPKTTSDPGGPGLALLWSKLFGDVPATSSDRLHPNSSVTFINALKTTVAGDVVIAGGTNSIFYPVTPRPASGGGAYQTTLSGGQSGVVTVLDYTGNVVNSTYLGISAADDHESKVSLASVAVDSSGNVIVGGSFDHVDRLWWVWSEGWFTPATYPITSNAFLPIETSENLGLNGYVGITDAVMTKLDPSLSSITYSIVDAANSYCDHSSTQLINHTTGEKVAVDSNDNMYLLMLTNAECMYTTAQAVQGRLAGFREPVLLKVAPNGYAKGTGKPGFLYQSYLGFGPESAANHCALSVAPGLGDDVADNIYVGCSVVGARRKSLSNFVMNQIAHESVSAEDAQPIFAGENIVFARLDTTEKNASIVYTIGLGGTYANTLADFLFDAKNAAIDFIGGTLSEDFPVTATAYDRDGSTQRDGVFGIFNTTP